MSLARVNPKRDENEPEVIQALHRYGCLVLRLSGSALPDLLCGHQGRWFVVEVKADKGRLTDGQSELFQRCRLKRLPAFIVRSPDDVPAVLKTLRSNLYASKIANRPNP